MGDREGRGMGDREGRPYAGLVAGLFWRSGRPLRSPMPVFPTASFGSPRDAARAWHATSREGTTPCRIRDGRPRGSRDGRPRGSPLRGLVAGLFWRRGDPCGRPCRSSRRPRSGRHGTPRGRGTPPRAKERPRAGFGTGDREGRPRGSPLRGLVAGLFWCRGDPSHTTGHAVASGGWRRWVTEVRPRNRFSAIHNLPPGPSPPPTVGSPAGIHRSAQPSTVDGLSPERLQSPAASLSLCRLQPLSRPSSLLWLLLTSARLSTGRSPRVRCMNSRAGPSDSTRAFR